MSHLIPWVVRGGEDMRGGGGGVGWVISVARVCARICACMW